MLILNACQKNEFFNKDFKHNTPLIKEDVKKSGKSEVDKTVKMGPKPNEGDHKKLQKRKKYHQLKQKTI